jgi:hypothetical protein
MSTNKSATRRYTITVEAKPGTESDAIRALRWLLKRAWRSYELRCVDLREESTTPKGQEPWPSA